MLYNVIRHHVLFDIRKAAAGNGQVAFFDDSPDSRRCHQHNPRPDNDIRTSWLSRNESKRCGSRNGYRSDSFSCHRSYLSYQIQHGNSKKTALQKAQYENYQGHILYRTSGYNRTGAYVDNDLRYERNLRLGKRGRCHRLRTLLQGTAVLPVCRFRYA